MRKKISLAGRRSLIASYLLAPNKSRRWVVYLPESNSEFQSAHRLEIRSLLGPRLSKDFNFLVINKPGISAKKTNLLAFEQSFRRKRRVSDYLTTLKEIVPAEDEIFLVGYSEGAYLAPEVALADSRVRAVVMIGGGTRGWLREEISNAGPRERTALRRQIRDIYKHPRSTKKWNGFSYATWYSYRGDETYKALRKLRKPTLAILGGRDRTIDLKSALQDLRRLARHESLRVKLFDRCGHSFVSHWADAWHEVRKFLYPFV
jgi:pimeloyl-ACP methyl ester carboxylesterase